MSKLDNKYTITLEDVYGDSSLKNIFEGLGEEINKVAALEYAAERKAEALKSKMVSSNAEHVSARNARGGATDTIHDFVNQQEEFGNLLRDNTLYKGSEIAKSDILRSLTPNAILDPKTSYEAKDVYDAKGILTGYNYEPYFGPERNLYIRNLGGGMSKLGLAASDISDEAAAKGITPEKARYLDKTKYNPYENTRYQKDGTLGYDGTSGPAVKVLGDALMDVRLKALPAEMFEFNRYRDKATINARSMGTGYEAETPGNVAKYGGGAHEYTETARDPLFSSTNLNKATPLSGTVMPIIPKGLNAIGSYVGDDPGYSLLEINTDNDGYLANIVDGLQYGVGKTGAGLLDMVADGLIRAYKESGQAVSGKTEKETSDELKTSILGGYLDKNGNFTALDAYKTPEEYGYQSNISGWTESWKETMQDPNSTILDKISKSIEGVLLAPEVLASSAGEMILGSLGVVGWAAGAALMMNETLEVRAKIKGTTDLELSDYVIAGSAGAIYSMANTFTKGMAGFKPAYTASLGAAKGLDHVALRVLTNWLYRGIAEVGGSALEEGTEEVIQGITEVVGQRLDTSKQDTILTKDTGYDLAVQGLLGAATGGATKAVALPFQGIDPKFARVKALKTASDSLVNDPEISAKLYTLNSDIATHDEQLSAVTTLKDKVSSFASLDDLAAALNNLETNNSFSIGIISNDEGILKSAVEGDLEGTKNALIGKLDALTQTITEQRENKSFVYNDIMEQFSGEAIPSIPVDKYTSIDDMGTTDVDTIKANMLASLEGSTNPVVNAVNEATTFEELQALDLDVKDAAIMVTDLKPFNEMISKIKVTSGKGSVLTMFKRLFLDASDVSDIKTNLIKTLASIPTATLSKIATADFVNTISEGIVSEDGYKPLKPQYIAKLINKELGKRKISDQFIGVTDIKAVTTSDFDSTEFGDIRKEIEAAAADGTLEDKTAELSVRFAYVLSKATASDLKKHTDKELLKSLGIDVDLTHTSAIKTHKMPLSGILIDAIKKAREIAIKTNKLDTWSISDKRKYLAETLKAKAVGSMADMNIAEDILEEFNLSNVIDDTTYSNIKRKLDIIRNNSKQVLKENQKAHTARVEAIRKNLKESTELNETAINNIDNMTDEQLMDIYNAVNIDENTVKLFKAMGVDLTKEDFGKENTVTKIETIRMEC